MSWDSTNRQVILQDLTGTQYCNYAGYTCSSVISGYATPGKTTVLATINSNGEFLVVDIAPRTGKGYIHVYCYYDNDAVIARHFHQQE